MEVAGVFECRTSSLLTFEPGVFEILSLNAAVCSYFKKAIQDRAVQDGPPAKLAKCGYYSPTARVSSILGVSGRGRCRWKALAFLFLPRWVSGLSAIGKTVLYESGCNSLNLGPAGLSFGG